MAADDHLAPSGPNHDSVGSPAGTPEASNDANDATLVVGANESSSASDPFELQRGTFVGRYVILAGIAAGGMGVVYSAYDPELDRKVAIKVLRTDRLQEDTGSAFETEASARARALREAQALAKLSHPNVLPIFDVGTIDGQIFLATEFVDGETLRDWIRAEGREWKAVLAAFMAAGRGLAAAHAQGMVHRDFKPQNVLVGNDGAVRVMDFGLVRRAGADDDVHGQLSSGTSVPTHLANARDAPHDTTRAGTQELTRVGAVMGTPPYMAPEQHDGLVVDARADQYAFCVSLYEGLYGRRPFAGKGEALVAAKRELRLEALQPNVERKVPRWIRRIVIRGLSPDPKLRYASMQELLTQLAHDPRKKWRNLASVAVAGAVAAGGIAYGQSVKAPPLPPPCEGSEQRLASIWDGARAAKIQAAFAATHLDYADAMWNKVRARLDQHADAWVGMHRDACEATQVRHEQSAALMDLRMACLQARLWELDSLGRVLESADASVVENAVKAAAKLGPIERCGDLDALRAEVAPPQSPQLRAQVDGLRQQLASIKAQHDAGLLSVALTEVEPVLVQAKATAYDPLIAEVMFRQGQLELDSGKHKEAEQTLEEAGWLAESQRMRELTAEAQTALVYVVGYALARPQEGLKWARHADAALQSAGGRKDLASLLMTNRGSTLSRSGDLEEAHALMVEAAKLREEALGAEHPSMVGPLSGVGVLARSLDRPREAADYLRRAISIGEQTLGPTHPDLAAPLHNLGTAMVDLGNYDEAEQFQDRALSIWMRADTGNNVRVAHAYGCYSLLRRAQKRHDEALELLEKSRTMRLELLGRQHPDYVQTLAWIGAVHEDMERYSLAAKYYEEAFQLADKSDPHAEPLLIIRIGRARTQAALGRRQRAIAELEALVETLGKIKIPPRVHAEGQFALAKALFGEGDRDRAMALAREAGATYAKGPMSGDLDQARRIQDWLTEHGVH